MFWPFLQSLARHGLTSAGAILVTKGLASSQDTDTAAGAIMVLIGFGHSIWQKWRAFQEAESKPAVSSPRSSSSPSPLMALMLLPFLVAGAVTLSGCNTTPQQVTYQVAGTTAVSVDTAMNMWGSYVASNHPPAAEEQSVKNAYEKYQAAMAAVCDAGAIYSSLNVTNAPAASAALQTAIGNASQEIVDLENLIASFGVKLQ